MKILVAPLNTDINPRASQAVAAAKRARQEDDAPPVPVRPRQHLIAGIVGVLAVLGVLALAISQHGSVPSARPLAIPTTMPAQALDKDPVAASTIAPAFTSAPQPTRAPDLSPVPPAPVLAAPVLEPQTGRGLTVDLAIPTPAPPLPEPSYVEIVGAQSPHCIRTCDGQPGVSGGDWALVPTAAPAMLSVIGQQAPHKVR